jgi:hypothetical protein
MQDVTSQVGLHPLYCIAYKNRMITDPWPANFEEENVLGLSYVLFRHVWTFWEKWREVSEWQMFRHEMTSLGLPTMYCLRIRSVTAWPPPHSRRYQGKDAHHIPLHLTLLLSTRLGWPHFPLDAVENNDLHDGQFVAYFLRRRSYELCRGM